VPATPAVPFWRNPRHRATLYQAVFLLASIGFAGWLFGNAMDHLQAHRVSHGFGFLWSESSVPVSETVPLPDAPALRTGGALFALAVIVALMRPAGALVSPFRRTPRWIFSLAASALLLAAFGAWFGGGVNFVSYRPPAPYGLALATALVNTLKVAAVAVVLSLLLGLLIGLCRLSPNLLLSRIALAYVELMRNLPLLLHVFFWYFGILQTLPGVRGSLRLGDLVFLNNRGMIVAEPTTAPASAIWLLLLVIAAAAIAVLVRVAGVRRRAGRSAPLAVPVLAVLAFTCVLGSIAGAPLHLDRPQLRGFNFVGGLSLTPEFAALLIALTLYHAAFVAEIVRSAIGSVHAAQTEAELSLGLSRGRVLWLIVLPQAQRVAIPALISSSLGLIKDTSLGVTIGYPELVEVSGTVLEVSGQVFEVIVLVVGFYMTITLSFSALVNWYHAKLRLPGS
jgi:general L-amino acid transport system permease protein